MYESDGVSRERVCDACSTTNIRVNVTNCTTPLAGWLAGCVRVCVGSFAHSLGSLIARPLRKFMVHTIYIPSAQVEINKNIPNNCVSLIRSFAYLLVPSFGRSAIRFDLMKRATMSMRPRAHSTSNRFTKTRCMCV